MRASHWYVPSRWWTLAPMLLLAGLAFSGTTALAEESGLATYLTGKPFGSAVDRTAEAMPNGCPTDATPEPRIAGAQWNGATADPTSGARFQSREGAGLTAEEGGSIGSQGPAIVRRHAVHRFGLLGTGKRVRQRVAGVRRGLTRAPGSGGRARGPLFAQGSRPRS